MTIACDNWDYLKYKTIMTIACDNFPHNFHYQGAAGFYNLYSCNACFGFKITILIATTVVMTIVV